MKYLLVATLTEYCSCDVYTGLLEPIRHSNIAPMGLSNEAGLSVDCGVPFLFSNFCSKNGISFLHVYSFPVAFFLASVGSALKGGHCHVPCRVVSHVTAVTLL